MVAENAKIIRDRIARACKRVGRSGDDITLIAVTKSFGTEEIRMAYEAGIRDIGENYVQEARRKHEELSDKPLRWHFIGHLQSNKIKYLADWISMIHTVDSIELGKQLSAWGARTKRTFDVLVEVNTTGEATKYGVTIEKASSLAKELSTLPNIHLRGFMTIGRFLPDPEESRPAFRSLRKLRDVMQGEGVPMTDLSMGMTNDFEVAIEEGATHVRIGTGLFGKRPKKNLEEEKQ